MCSVSSLGPSRRELAYLLSVKHCAKSFAHLFSFTRQPCEVETNLPCSVHEEAVARRLV